MSNTANEARRAIVTELKDTGNFLDAAVCHLFKSPMVVDPNLVLADFTAVEADFDGYAAIATGAWGAVGTNVLDQAEVSATELEFVPNGTTTPNVIYGYYITDAGDTNLLFYTIFPDPIAVNGPPDVVRVVPLFQYPDAA